MFCYVENDNCDPKFNLALEEYILEKLPVENSYFMLWRNNCSIIVGRNQNTAQEVCEEYVREHGIQIVRRMSGGGAVFHDLGNINYSFVADYKKGDMYSFFEKKILEILSEFGICAEISGRNDIILNGKKISGNAEFIRGGRVLHHGTILFDSDLDMARRALHVSALKCSSKTVMSHHKEMMNLKPLMNTSMKSEEFMLYMRNYIFKKNDAIEYKLSESDLLGAKLIQHNKYDRIDWNFKNMPDYNARNQCYVEGCGLITTLMEMREGIIKNISFQGDYLGNRNISELERVLTDQRYSEKNIRMALQNIDVDNYIRGASKDIIVRCIFECDKTM